MSGEVGQRSKQLPPPAVQLDGFQQHAGQAEHGGEVHHPGDIHPQPKQLHSLGHGSPWAAGSGGHRYHRPGAAVVFIQCRAERQVQSPSGCQITAELVGRKGSIPLCPQKGLRAPARPSSLPPGTARMRVGEAGKELESRTADRGRPQRPNATGALRKAKLKNMAE